MSLGKKYILTNHWFFLVASMTCFAFVAFFFIQMIRYEGMGIANTIWAATSVVGGVVVGFFIFHEKITSFQFLGIFLSLLGIVLLQWHTK
jgi:multidrug transporter EmrE-like cation transporter